MLRRFFYFPTPTFQGCTTDLEEVKFDDCDPLVLLSEIRRIFVAKYNTAAFTDWSDSAEWESRLSDVSVAGDDYIRTLVVRGNKPAPSSTVKELSNNRRKTINKNHVLNFTIDEVWAENHDFLRQLEAGGQVVIWYETHGGLLFGGNEGIKTFIRLDMVLNEGTDEMMIYSGVLEWKNQFTEERIDSPIFDIVSSTSGSFDTTLEFSASATDTAQGVTSTIAAADPDVQFLFNAISPRTGSPASMDINLSGTQVMTVDFTTDYNGAAFKFIDQAGVAHFGTFAAGNVNF